MQTEVWNIFKQLQAPAIYHVIYTNVKYVLKYLSDDIIFEMNIWELLYFDRKWKTDII